MPRSAVARSCSTTAPELSILAGDSVPQNGHTSFCFAGFHTASPPHAGQANLESATVSFIDEGGRAGALAGSTNEVADDAPLAVRLELERHGFMAFAFLRECGAEL